MIELEWKIIDHKNTTYLYGKIRKFTIFNIYWDGCRSTNELNRYKLTCTLPGIKDYLGHFLNEEEAKEKAKKVLNYWLKETGLIEKGDK